jgi:hypothetical protein
MERKIPCFCDNSFTVEAPEEIDLDLNPGYMDEIQNGTFMSFLCPSCGKKHKPEFPLTVLWASKQVRFEVFPELARGEFYRRKKEVPPRGPVKQETVIGYPEMADRLAVIRDGLEPAAVEAIKYYLHIKAEENYPDDEMEIWYASSSPESLEFHIHGIRRYEVAIVKAPRSTYEKTLKDFLKNPKGGLFSSLRVRSYLSVKNTMRPEELK